VNKRVTKNDDEGLTLELVAAQEVINPLSVLIQVVENLETFKKDLRETNSKSEEYLSILRSLKTGDHINTCSHTL
jgi:hypothetical protein